MRALIVEDDAATRALLVATTRERHHDVQPYADAESVWAALAAGAEPGAFDLAVVDIGLPGQDGIAFCRQFRRHAAGRHAIILLVTADERAETLEAALEAGAHDYVIKPIERRRFAVRLAIAEQRSLANATSRYSREALRESEHRFEAFMTNSPALAFIKDAHGRFLYVNRRYLEVFGITESEVIGRTVHEIFDEAIAIPLLANDVDVIEHGPREIIEAVPLPDGLHRWLTYKFPLADTAGRNTLVAGIAIDITDRLRAEEALRGQTARAEALLQVASQVNSQRDVPAILQGICDHTREALGVDMAGIVLHVPSAQRMELAALAGGTPALREFLKNIPYGPDARPVSDDSLVVIGNVAMAQQPELAALSRLGLKSAAFVRMLRDGEYLGAMGVAALEQTPYLLGRRRGAAAGRGRSGGAGDPQRAPARRTPARRRADAQRAETGKPRRARRRHRARLQQPPGRRAGQRRPGAARTARGLAGPSADSRHRSQRAAGRRADAPDARLLGTRPVPRRAGGSVVGGRGDVAAAAARHLEADAVVVAAWPARPRGRRRRHAAAPGGDEPDHQRVRRPRRRGGHRDAGNRHGAGGPRDAGLHVPERTAARQARTSTSK